MLELQIRKNIRLDLRNYIGQIHCFVTICCFHRHAAFLDPILAKWILPLLRSESVAKSFRVHAYCLMPDHLHFLAEGTKPTSDLLRLVKSFKTKSSRRYTGQSGRILWQERFYEHLLRTPESVEAVAWYIWLNPVRKGLVTMPQDYPYVGSFIGMRMPSVWNAPEWRPPWKYMPCPNS